MRLSVITIKRYDLSGKIYDALAQRLRFQDLNGSPKAKYVFTCSLQRLKREGQGDLSLNIRRPGLCNCLANVIPKMLRQGEDVCRFKMAYACLRYRGANRQ